MIENQVNVVPNAWLTRKMVVPRASHVNPMIAFAMHGISMPESFISMRCGRSIANQNFFPLNYGVEPSTCFKERFIKSRSSMEVTSLWKLGQKMDRVTLFLCLLPIYKNIEDCSHLCVISNLTLTRCDGPCSFNENLNWFNPMSRVKFSILQQCIIRIHPWFSLVALLIAFFPWNQNCNNCYQKERMRFMTPLPNACKSG